MPDYIYLIHPLRNEFFDDPTALEIAAVEAHYDYLRRATEGGTVLLAGPCLDDTFGIVVFSAEDDEAARAFMLEDPAVKSNVMMAELHPMKVSLIRKC